MRLALLRGRPQFFLNDRFTSNAYDLVIEGESYRPRLKPRVVNEAKERSR